MLVGSAKQMLFPLQPSIGVEGWLMKLFPEGGIHKCLLPLPNGHLLMQSEFQEIFNRKSFIVLTFFFLLEIYQKNNTKTLKKKRCKGFRDGMCLNPGHN